jgi:hypothetical protein
LPPACPHSSTLCPHCAAPPPLWAQDACGATTTGLVTVGKATGWCPTHTKRNRRANQGQESLSARFARVFTAIHRPPSSTAPRSGGTPYRGVPQDHGLPRTTNTLGIVVRGLVADCAAFASPWRRALSATCRQWGFAGRRPPSSGQRTLAGAMSYLHCPQNSTVLPLPLSPEA